MTWGFQNMCLCGQNGPMGKREVKVNEIAFAMRNAKTTKEFKRATSRLYGLLVTEAKKNPEFGSFQLLKSEPAIMPNGHKISFTLVSNDGKTDREISIVGKDWDGTQRYDIASDYKSQSHHVSSTGYFRDETQLIQGIKNMLSNVGRFPRWIEKIPPQREIQPGHFAWI